MKRGWGFTCSAPEGIRDWSGRRLVCHTSLKISCSSSWRVWQSSDGSSLLKTLYLLSSFSFTLHLASMQQSEYATMIYFPLCSFISKIIHPHGNGLFIGLFLKGKEAKVEEIRRNSTDLIPTFLLFTFNRIFNLLCCNHHGYGTVQT